MAFNQRSQQVRPSDRRRTSGLSSLPAQYTPPARRQDRDEAEQNDEKTPRQVPPVMPKRRSSNINEPAAMKDYEHSYNPDSRQPSKTVPLPRPPSGIPPHKPAPQTREDFSQLSSVLEGFSNIGTNQYPSMLKFCNKYESVWEEDIDPLEEGAINLLRTGRDNTARQLAHRYLLLQKCRKTNDVNKKLGVIDILRQNVHARKAFDVELDQYLENLKLKGERPQKTLSATTSRPVHKVAEDKSETESEDNEEDEDEDEEELERREVEHRAEYEDEDEDDVGVHRDDNERYRFNNKHEEEEELHNSQRQENNRFGGSLLPRKHTATLPYRQSTPTIDLESFREEHPVPSPSFESAASHSPPDLAASNITYSRREPRRMSTITVQDMDTVIREAPLGVSGGGLPETVLGNLPPKFRALLDQNYVIYRGRKRINSVFCLGSVIAVFWHESYGQLPPKLKNLPNQPESAVKVGPGWVTQCIGEAIYSHVRRYIIIEQRAGFSVGIPISSYGGKGLKKNLPPNELMAHTVVYALGKEPVLLADEPDLKKQPICVKITCDDPRESLTVSSRLYYAKPQSIDHNIKIKYLGYVIPEHIPRLVEDFRRELFPEHDATGHVETPELGQAPMYNAYTSNQYGVEPGYTQFSPTTGSQQSYH